jgi:hypothetical protein
MNAKQERAHHLELHKMKRINNELSNYNAALEAECNHLRRVSEKHAAEMEAERVKMNALHQANNEAQRQNAKLMLDAALNEHRAALDAAIQKLKEERVQMKNNDLMREREYKQLAEQLAEQMAEQLAAQRKMIMDKGIEEKRRQEAHFNSEIQKLKEERVQMKNNDLMREREYKQLAEQLAEQMAEQLAAQRKTIMDKGIEEKQRQEAHFNSEIQKLNEERKQMAEQLAAQRKMIMDEWIEEKRRQEALFNSETQKLNEDCTQIKAQLKTIMDEGIEEKRRQEAHFNSEIQKLNEERRQMKNNDLMREREYKQLSEQMVEQLAAQRKTIMDEGIEEKRRQERKMSADLESHKLKVRLELDAAISESLHDAVTSNCTHMQWMNALDFRGKRVMLYSHYSESNEVQDYNVLTIEFMQHYFDHIIILTNCPNKWNMLSPNYNQCHLLNYNMKSDFRNYGAFIMQLEPSLVNASRLCLTNDSFIVVDVNSFSLCIKRLFDRETMSHDFIGLTSSHENVYHLQSYFICFGSAAIPEVMSYFKTHGLPFNHTDAIAKYELGMSLHLTNIGLTSFAFVTNNDMQRPLNTTCCKWSIVLEETGIVKRQHFLKKYGRAGMTDKDIAKIAENHAYNAELLQFLKCNNVSAFTPK